VQVGRTGSAVEWSRLGFPRPRLAGLCAGILTHSATVLNRLQAKKARRLSSLPLPLAILSTTFTSTCMPFSSTGAGPQRQVCQRVGRLAFQRHTRQRCRALCLVLQPPRLLSRVPVRQPRQLQVSCCNMATAATAINVWRPGACQDFATNRKHAAKACRYEHPLILVLDTLTAPLTQALLSWQQGNLDKTSFIYSFTRLLNLG